MCLARPGKVIEVVDREARLGRADVLGTLRTVNLSLLGGVAPGEWVLIHLGFAVEKISEAEAAELTRLFGELGAAFEETEALGSEEARS